MSPLFSELIKTYYAMSDGAHITLFQEALLMHEGAITLYCTRRALKHIIEQRKKKDAASLESITQFFQDAKTILTDNRYTILDNTQDADGDVLLIETDAEKSVGVVLILEIVIHSDGTYFLKTGFYRAASKLKKILKKQGQQK